MLPDSISLSPVPRDEAAREQPSKRIRGMLTDLHRVSVRRTGVDTFPKDC